MKKLLLILFCVQLIYSCKKSNVSGNCESLKDAILNNDVAKTGALVNNFIDQLRNKTYTEPNLTALVQKISSQCNVTGEVLCFDCIKTLPSQSEIRITINSGGTVVSKTIDISYSATNNMTFQNMHD